MSGGEMFLRALAAVVFGTLAYALLVTVVGGAAYKAYWYFASKRLRRLNRGYDKRRLLRRRCTALILSDYGIQACFDTRVEAMVSWMALSSTRPAGSE